VNGDLFTHLVAVAPGRLNPPAPTIGEPRILVAHGTQDNVYSVHGSRNYIVPNLEEAGYDVTYLEFDGPHWMPEPVAYETLNWDDMYSCIAAENAASIRLAEKPGAKLDREEVVASGGRIMIYKHGMSGEGDD